MKLAAGARPGLRRDFWDLHVLLTQTELPIQKMLDAYCARFGLQEPDTYHVLRALAYFDDAEAETAYPAGLTASAWSVIRKHMERTAATELRRLLESR